MSGLLWPRKALIHILAFLLLGAQARSSPIILMHYYVAWLLRQTRSALQVEQEDDNEVEENEIEAEGYVSGGWGLEWDFDDDFGLSPWA